MTVTIEEQVACVAREVALRKNCYPKWVASGRMKQELADKELATMEAVLQNLILQKDDKNSEEKGDGLHNKFMAIYIQWHREQFGIEPKINSIQGKALKEIIVYLKKQVKHLDEETMLASWRMILDKKQSLGAFLADQNTLTQISKYLDEIIVKIRKQHIKLEQQQNSGLEALRAKASQ